MKLTMISQKQIIKCINKNDIGRIINHKVKNKILDESHD